MIDSEAALELSFFLWDDVGVAVLGVDPEFRRDMISVSLKLSAIRKNVDYRVKIMMRNASDVIKNE